MADGNITGPLTGVVGPSGSGTATNSVLFTKDSPGTVITNFLQINWYVPGGVNLIYLDGSAAGGGGFGGRAGAPNTAGGGGGSGMSCIGFPISVTPGGLLTIAIPLVTPAETDGGDFYITGAGLVTWSPQLRGGKAGGLTFGGDGGGLYGSGFGAGGTTVGGNGVAAIGHWPIIAGNGGGAPGDSGTPGGTGPYWASQIAGAMPSFGNGSGGEGAGGLWGQGGLPGAGGGTPTDGHDATQGYGGGGGGGGLSATTVGGKGAAGFCRFRF